MAWNNNLSVPNWSGIKTIGSINPISSNIINASTINVSSLNVNFISSAVANISSINTNNISSATAFISSINGISIQNFSASNWYTFPAQCNVTATLGPFGVPQYDISNFRNIYCRELNTTQNVNCGNTVNALVGTIGAINCPDILMSPGDKVANLDVYGTNLVAGNNALYVEGGTTLTGGGVVHGVTIGALQVAGIDTVRIDVLPAGLAFNSATFITANAAGAANIAAGGALSLAGGSYIEYNTDENRFINTTSGNDFTDIYVGNIHSAFGGSAPLRINDASRGVELANVNSMIMATALTGVANWSNIFYSVGSKVRILGFIPTYYNALVYNRETFPTIPIPDWVSGTAYDANIIVFSAGLVYRCLAFVSGSTPPASDPTKWESLGFTTNSISNIWAVYSPSIANITGDDVSQITIGKITPSVDFVRLAGDGLVGTTGLQTIGNIKTLTLTTTLFSEWNSAVVYGSNAEVSFGAENWVSQFAGNTNNTPQASLDDWLASGFYPPGAVRYYAPTNNAYICILSIFGVSMPVPPSDPTHWSVFQVGNNGEDVWYPFTPPVVSAITGDRLSELQIGQINCVGDVGSYLEISANPENNANATIQSAGAVGILANTGVVILTVTGDTTIGSADGKVTLDAKTDVLLASAEGNVEFSAPAGNAIITCAGNNGITSTGANVNLNAFNNVSITSVVGEINITGITNISSINTNYISTGSLYVKNISLDSISSFRISTGTFFANQINARSTITQSLTPDIVGAASNNIKVSGHLSTVSLGVSTINFKPYTFVSTLNNAIITTTATTTSGTPGLTRLQSNTLRFPFPGTYKVFQKYSITKGSGGGIHGSLIYSSNTATTTTVANSANWLAQGMSACPFQDTAGMSTFTTAVTTVLANSANLTRDLYYYDSGSGNYTASFYISPPQITYIPSAGINPDI